MSWKNQKGRYYQIKIFKGRDIKVNVNKDMIKIEVSYWADQTIAFEDIQSVDFIWCLATVTLPSDLKEKVTHTKSKILVPYFSIQVGDNSGTTLDKFN